MTKKERKLLFSVTAADCEWSYSHGQGAGGQNRNKSLSAVHCKHKASGAMGWSQDGRSQASNKSDAFVKMCNTPEFKAWHQREVWKHLGILDQIEHAVERGMQQENLRIEVKKDGKWVEVPYDSITEIDEDGAQTWI